VTDPHVKIRKTQLTAVITSKTVIEGQNVQKISISIRRQNIAKTSVLLVVRIPVKFHSADSATKKVRYCNLIVTRTLFAEEGR
jgi:mannose/fructose/N-acetylgalactosamine-specific phosphotransferase system component IIB